MKRHHTWLTQEMFVRSHFESGSGTSLQPLLRFSDRCTEFLFVDFELELHDVERHLLSGFAVLSSPEICGDEGSPLVLHKLSRYEDLHMSDFELSNGPNATWREVQRLHSESDVGVEQYFSSFSNALRGRSQRQWGLEANVIRRIPHTDGTVEERPLTLRIVGGEGLLTFIGMGGMSRPPASIGTTQKGWGELSEGHLAELFRSQAQRGAPLPPIWIRESNPGQKVGSTSEPHRAASPFSVLGQVYAHWMADRHWPSTPGTELEVKAWIHEQQAGAPVTLGPHKIVDSRLTQSMVLSSGAACLPASLANDLQVCGNENIHVVQPPKSSILSPMSKILEAWQETLSFKSAKNAVFVPYAYEDELAVLTRWLRALPSPAITVHLTMALDFEAARRAVNTPG